MLGRSLRTGIQAAATATGIRPEAKETNGREEMRETLMSPIVRPLTADLLLAGAESHAGTMGPRMSPPLGERGTFRRSPS